jgi:hypothetical protein
VSFASLQPTLISRNRYTKSALTDRIKKTLATTKLNIEEYINNIEKHKNNRDPNKYYFDYYQELDFSIDTEDPKSIERKIYDDRLYYYKAHHYLKLGLFLKKDAPIFKVNIDHMPSEIIYELSQLDSEDRRIFLKQAVSRIFEDVNFDVYHDSISANMKVILVK